MIEYHDPQANSSVAVTPYQLSVGLAAGKNVTVGLLANGFPDSENFLNLVAEALEIEVPGISFARYNKGNASIPASAEILSGIASQCQAVITAYGH